MRQEPRPARGSASGESSAWPTSTSARPTSSCPRPTTPRSWGSASQRTDDAVYLKCWDEEDHHSLRLRYDPRTGTGLCSPSAWRREDDLHDLENRLAGYGCHVQRVSQGRGRRPGRVDPLRDPSGQIMELVWDLEKTGNILGKHNPSPVPPPDLPGIAPPAHRPPADQRRGGRRGRTRSSGRCSGFRLTEQVLDGNGHQLGVWLGRIALAARHRDRQRPQRRAAPLGVLARRLGPRPQGGRHPGLQRRADRPGPDPARRHPRQHHLLLRPARHPQRGVHRRLLARPGLPEIITWTEDQFGRGLFYYENVISQRFLRFHT